MILGIMAERGQSQVDVVSEARVDRVEPVL